MVSKPPLPYAYLAIRDRTIVDDALKIIAPFSGRHAERNEDSLPSELGERFSRHASDQNRQKIKASVGVGPFCAWRIIEHLLPGRDVENVHVGIDARGARPSSDRGDAAPISQTAGVIQQMTDGDRATVIGKFGDVFPHWIVQRQLPFLLQQQHRRGCELLGHRAGLKD